MIDPSHHLFVSRFRPPIIPMMLGRCIRRQGVARVFRPPDVLHAAANFVPRAGALRGKRRRHCGGHPDVAGAVGGARGRPRVLLHEEDGYGGCVICVRACVPACVRVCVRACTTHSALIFNRFPIKSRNVCSACAVARRQWEEEEEEERRRQCQERDATTTATRTASERNSPTRRHNRARPKCRDVLFMCHPL